MQIWWVTLFFITLALKPAETKRGEIQTSLGQLRQEEGGNRFRPKSLEAVAIGHIKSIWTPGHLSYTFHQRFGHVFWCVSQICGKCGNIIQLFWSTSVAWRLCKVDKLAPQRGKSHLSVLVEENNSAVARVRCRNNSPRFEYHSPVADGNLLSFPKSSVGGSGTSGSYRASDQKCQTMSNQGMFGVFEWRPSNVLLCFFGVCHVFFFFFYVDMTQCESISWPTNSAFFGHQRCWNVTKSAVFEDPELDMG